MTGRTSDQSVAASVTVKDPAGDANDGEQHYGREELLADSSHNYLFRKCSIEKKILAYLVLAAQIACYVLFYTSVHGEAATVPLEILDLECPASWTSPSGGTTPNVTLAEVNVRCEVHWNSAALIAGPLVLLVNVMPDVFAALRVCKKNLFVTVVLLGECGFALLVGMLVMLSLSSHGAIDVMSGGVGVMFIHDLDEQVKTAVDQIAQHWKCCCFKRCPSSNIFLIFLYMIIGAVVMIVLVVADEISAN